jgi:predicted dehydrogenase
MATEKIRVGIIGANVRYGWGRDTHIPALSAVCTENLIRVDAVMESPKLAE